MKRTLFLFLGVFCTFGYYSCQRNMIDDADELELASNRNDCTEDNESNIFDPTHLVSPSAHGKLDTIQKGFSFTEGPAVDKWGNVFFTDQPNDKIYRWDAS